MIEWGRCICGELLEVCSCPHCDKCINEVGLATAECKCPKCDRCYHPDFGDGPYEDGDGDYICESCYQDDVSKAEYIGEGDR